MTVEVKKARMNPGCGTGWELWVDRTFRGHFSSHRAAWREADRISGEVMSRAEDVSSWINKKG